MIEKAIDMYNGNVHTYPPLEEDIPKLSMRYDFVFTKNGKWFYNSSTHDINVLDRIDVHIPVEKAGENWALVDNLTGKIIKSNLK